MATRVTKGRPPNTAHRGSFTEYGGSGLKQSSGVIREELLKELSGSRGVKIYKEMKDNCPIVGAFLFAVEQLMRQVDWKVWPASQDNADLKQAEFVDQCRQDLDRSWSEVITEVLTMLVYGWSLLEEVYKLRKGPNRDPKKHSRFSDGKVGWRTLAPRAQDSLHSWIPSPDKRGFLGMKQQTQELGIVDILFENSLLFRTKAEKDNPEGRSILRNAYRSWFFKKRIEEIEGIGVERDLAGLPVFYAPEGTDLWNKDDPNMVSLKGELEKMVRNIRRDEQEGVILPPGWELKLLSTGGTRTFDTTQIVNRYDQRIAMTVLADFILLGHGGKFGSFALAKSKTSAFTMSVVGYLNMMRDVFNLTAIPRLLMMNGEQVETPPRLDYTPIETPDLDKLGRYVANLFKIGVTVNTPSQSRYLLGAAGIPANESDTGGGGGVDSAPAPEPGEPAPTPGEPGATPATKPAAGEKTPAAAAAE